MSKVTVKIDGRSYQIGCAEGEEEQVERLGEELDQAIQTLKKSVGELGDRRLSIMAGILMADQRDELRKQNEALRREIEKLKSGRDDGMGRAQRVEEMLVAGLDRASARVEQMAEELNERTAARTAESGGAAATGRSGGGAKGKGRSSRRKPKTS